MTEPLWKSSWSGERFEIYFFDFVIIHPDRTKFMIRATRGSTVTMRAAQWLQIDGPLNQILSDIHQRANHKSCGEVSLHSWFRMLSFYGYDEIVYDFFTWTDSASYGYAIIHGATSLSLREDWDDPVPAWGQG